LEEPFLYDISFGDWEGKADREVFSSKEEEKRWHTDPHSFIIPNGETFYQVLDRIHRLFKRLENQKEENIALVSHGVVISLMFVYLYKTHPSNFWKFFVKPCSISHIVLKESGNFKLVKINDFHHLQD
jgi:alpha-ribazole phosphatase